jgi:hypothetical protein
VLLMGLGLITNIFNNSIYSSEIIVKSLGLNDIFTSQVVHFCNVPIPSSLVQDQQQRDKNIVKRATQVHRHSLKLHFCMFEISKGKHNSLNCHIFLEYFQLIAKFICSKLDTNKKKIYMLKAFKFWKWTILVFFQMSF